MERYGNGDIPNKISICVFLEDGRNQDLVQWLGPPRMYKWSFRQFGRGMLPYLGDLLTMVINHLLHPGMILLSLQVQSWEAFRITDLADHLNLPN